MHSNGARAFSLLEVVIAMGILAVGVVGAMRVFPMGLRASRRAELRSRAAIAAQRTIELLKAQSCASLADGSATTDEGLTVATRITGVSVPFVSDSARLKTAELHVSWTQEGATRTLRFVTYVRCPAS
ncbi:MAG: hypothetical protein COV75_04455 [Candidatus Omnitrophica bacterium CG11_big_fil_rev_8_21_14_0_20_63_9]|nr:MAG: hypothetical protein COV75_04455 [Candidatus Omnitrophica bacterium CG11_big_fil_rev_8_21_14_0_20_63_9]